MIEAGVVARACTWVVDSKSTRLLGLLLVCSSMALAETADPAASPDSASTTEPAAKEKAKGANQEAALDSVYVEGKRWLFNRRTRYAHSLPEVDGPTITVTKKTSVVQLNDVPTIIDNNQRSEECSSRRAIAASTAPRRMISSSQFRNRNSGDTAA